VGKRKRLEKSPRMGKSGWGRKGRGVNDKSDKTRRRGGTMQLRRNVGQRGTGASAEQRERFKKEKKKNTLPWGKKMKGATRLDSRPGSLAGQGGIWGTTYKKGGDGKMTAKSYKTAEVWGGLWGGGKKVKTSGGHRPSQWGPGNSGGK